jgi:hypothetical protein
MTGGRQDFRNVRLIVSYDCLEPDFYADRSQDICYKQRIAVGPPPHEQLGTDRDGFGDICMV